MLGRYRETVRHWSDPVGRVLFRLRLRPNHTHQEADLSGPFLPPHPRREAFQTVSWLHARASIRGCQPSDHPENVWYDRTSRNDRIERQTTMSSAPLSVVIVSWNGMRQLPECLAALLPQLPPDAEVILVDNGSTDGMPAWAQANHPQLRVIALPENLGGRALHRVW